MNVIFYALVLIAFVGAAFTGSAEATGKAALDSAKTAAELAIGLVGYVSLFLGLMKVVEEAGGLRFMARLIEPLLARLFPDVPRDHPAMGAMVMNLAANALGLGNAATPFGLKAMKELETLNRRPGVATDAMALFLAINTSGVALLPTGMIGLRAKLGSVDPAAIFPTTLFATACSTSVAILAALLLRRLPAFRLDGPPPPPAPPRPLTEMLPPLAFGAALIGLVTAVYLGGPAVSAWILPVLIVGMLTVGVVRKVKVYEVFVAGAREGFQMSIGIIPYLVAILVAVGMLRASGALDAFVSLVGPLSAAVGVPAEVIPLGLLRPLSGSGAMGLTTELMETHGPDSTIGTLAATINGSTETTFYVLAVYFGSIGITRSRHAVPAGLAADIAGFIGAIVACRLLLGP